MIGKRFGRLQVVSLSHRIKNTEYWNCICDCGNTACVGKNNLTNGHVKSCKCLQRESRLFYSTTHGMRHTRFYGIWKGINGRCYVKSNHAYALYGEKGIGSAWRSSFEQFKKDMYRSYVSHVAKHGEKNTTIDRIDNKKDYSKENCRWATAKEQSHNRSVTILVTHKGITKPLVEWARITGIPISRYRSRYNRGLRGAELFKAKAGYPRQRNKNKTI